MRSMIDMDHLQVEITNFCPKSCANCTRFVQLVNKPYFMPIEEVKRAIDSMVGYPKQVGIMGGEALCHPQFKEICEYASEKIPHKQLALWSCFPKGKEHYNKLICDTFYSVFINDHTRPDIFHQPPLVAIQEVEPDKNKMWHLIDHCWAQESWSASINPRGAWFCEIAAALSMLFEEGEGWPVEPGWWWKTPKDFREQIEQFCPRCGFAIPTALRASVDNIDDISPLNYEALKNRVRHPERFVLHPLTCVKERPQMAAYKDFDYRNRIARRYGMYLIINEMGFWTPYMGASPMPEKSIFATIKERFAA
jgi:hypothetical protein